MGAGWLAPAIHLPLELTHSDQEENEQRMQVLPQDRSQWLESEVQTGSGLPQPALLNRWVHKFGPSNAILHRDNMRETEGEKIPYVLDIHAMDVCMEDLLQI